MTLLLASGEERDHTSIAAEVSHPGERMVARPTFIADPKTGERVRNFSKSRCQCPIKTSNPAPCPSKYLQFTEKVFDLEFRIFHRV